MLNPRFLEPSEILAIHDVQIARFGGMHGIRDEGLLESALAQPQATFGGELLHATIHEQAGAYLYHLSTNHPFIDGNKRTAFAAMDVFLRLNGYRLRLTNDQAYELVLQVVQGDIGKEELANYLEQAIGNF
ncbi:type II toxin-antitoxin system death-on-curing family toxin [Oscillatoria sp. FACHB-1407]|uniref:type II toxin-antitoxin system death-on-curing family toxin n=1 Tax=Oscillatoria sp. FACHB-1407 TaxID=2692847 RepID=UPI0016845358|nr:type II toxin-antitoxin system death-on-curing family toxin [Oscillatoria sp. FACHB-1407]MBD2465095.1 type II toxin-antitoxin system death-on-curing family toxin [Oscillatoria sp. FACHB-1407]